jgi:hypothetical protein
MRPRTGKSAQRPVSNALQYIHKHFAAFHDQRISLAREFEIAHHPGMNDIADLWRMLSP